MNVETLIAILIGVVVVPLIFGSYKYTNKTSGVLHKKIDELEKDMRKEMKELRENHLKHLEDRVSELERKII